MVEQSYGEWDQASPDYNPGYTASGASDGVYFDAKSGKYYGIIESRLKKGRSGFLGTKGSKYGSTQRDVYVLEEDQLDAFRAMHKKYSGGKFRKDYKKAMSGFKRLAYTNESRINHGYHNQTTTGEGGLSHEEAFGQKDNSPWNAGQAFNKSKYRPDESYEEEWLKTFMGQQASYLADTTQGERGKRRKETLLRRDAAREKYQSMMNTTGWSSK